MLPIYFWRRRGVVHPAPTPADVRGAKAGLSRAEIRSRRNLRFIAPAKNDMMHGSRRKLVWKIRP